MMRQDRHLFEESLALMHNNLSEPLQTGELAAYLGITPKKLERIFRRYTGELPARFYRSLRLDLARGLLHGSGLGIDEIGRRCGFSSASHFSRCFRDFVGHSPREERKRREMPARLQHAFASSLKSEFFGVEHSS